MTFDNPHLIDFSDDTDELQLASLSEVDGKPILFLTVTLKQSREYGPDIHGILLNGMPPRFLVPVHPISEPAVLPEGTVQIPVAAVPKKVKAAPPPEPEAGAEPESQAVA